MACFAYTGKLAFTKGQDTGKCAFTKGDFMQVLVDFPHHVEDQEITK
jgi:hypothetical protein